MPEVTQPVAEPSGLRARLPTPIKRSWGDSELCMCGTKALEVPAGEVAPSPPPAHALVTTGTLIGLS